MTVMQHQFTVHDFRRGYAYPITQETVRGALGAELFQRLIDNASFTGTYGIQFRGDVWEVKRVDVGHPCGN